MLKRWNWLILLMIVLVPLWGCSDDDEAAPPTVPQQSAFEVMAAAGAAYINDSVDCPGVMTATALEAELDQWIVLDIRSDTDYNTSHITGAVNTSLGTLIADVAGIQMDSRIVIVCKSGQTAGHAKIALELLGYENVKSLKFGMSDWNGTLDVWTANCTDQAFTPETDDQNPNRTESAFPTITGTVNGRVADMLANGFKRITYENMIADAGYPNDYYVLNYFGQADYLGDNVSDPASGVPGHIPGAFQFTPYQSLGIEQELKYLPTDKKIIVYCWTGQHSSQVTAYLNMLGYDAYSLLFGSNNLFHTSLNGHKWNGTSNNFPLE